MRSQPEHSKVSKQGVSPRDYDLHSQTNELNMKRGHFRPYKRYFLKVLPVSSGICGIPALFELLDLDDFLLAPRFVALGSLAALPPAAPPAFGGTALLLAFFLDFDL